MITAYFLVFCYTNTIASCIAIQNLPSAAACDTVLAKVKAIKPAARKEACISYEVVASQTTASGNYLLAQ